MKTLLTLILLTNGMMLFAKEPNGLSNDTLVFYTDEYSKWNDSLQDYQLSTNISRTYLYFFVYDSNLIYTEVRSNERILLSGYHYVDRLESNEDHTLYLVSKSEIGAYALLVYKNGLHVKFEYWWDDKAPRMNVVSILDRYK